MVQLKAALALALEAVSTNIDLQGSADSSISINRVSGDSSVLASPPGNLSAASVGDIVSSKLINSQVSVNIFSGDLKMLGYSSGRLKIETVSGNVVLDTPILSQLHFSSLSGNGRLY